MQSFYRTISDFLSFSRVATGSRNSLLNNIMKWETMQPERIIRYPIYPLASGSEKKSRGQNLRMGEPLLQMQERKRKSHYSANRYTSKSSFSIFTESICANSSRLRRTIYDSSRRRKKCQKRRLCPFPCLACILLMSAAVKMSCSSLQYRRVMSSSLPYCGSG